jgi:D-alanyl-D-alanine dipeptidase
VDVTIVPMPVPATEVFDPKATLKGCDRPVKERFGDNSLDMGTGFDCFDGRSYMANPNLSWSQKQNRGQLKSLMEKYGFINMPTEWWHYTLKDEPFKGKQFTFDVQ